MIHGTPGDDVLIGSARSQRIFGGAGNDHICGGGGDDVIHGQGGNDVIHGGGRGDTLYGDGGSDRLYGDIQDDHLYGGSGPDLLVGGQGVDVMFGGAGDDLLRGGTNTDCYYGGGGDNTASFATATPPGPGQGIDGVRVSLSDPAKGACPRRGSGQADGDGSEGPEALSRIQFVVGSAFGDVIRGGPSAAVDAGLGADTCSGFPSGRTTGCGGGDEKPPSTYSSVFEPAASGPPDPGLIVRAAQGVPDETIDLGPGSVTGATVHVSGNPLAAGVGCDLQGATAACSSGRGPLGYVMVYGDDGRDTISVGNGLFPDTTVDIDGGPGNDVLNGSDTIGEVLFGGDSPGSDSLFGNGGDDAVISEGGTPDSGPDVLSGGSGDDQLVTDYPCAGDTFSGGPGTDVAGFARSRVGIRARLGGIATLADGRCPGGSPTSIGIDNEILEGTQSADWLIGSARPDTIWGRDGNDVLMGDGGGDTMEGFAGRDRIDARDGQRDRLIDCGSGADRGALRDRSDPRPISC